MGYVGRRVEGLRSISKHPAGPLVFKCLAV